MACITTKNIVFILWKKAGLYKAVLRQEYGEWELTGKVAHCNIWLKAARLTEMATPFTLSILFGKLHSNKPLMEVDHH